MARLITCEWDTNSVRLLVSHVQGNNIAIDKMVEIAITDEPTSESGLNPLESALESAAKAAGLSGQSDVVFVLRRAQTEMRLLTLPNIPTAELPDAVRFQVSQEFNTADDGPIDFAVLGETDDNRIFVTVATVAPEVLADVIATSNMAGLNSRSVVLSSFSTAHFLDCQTPSSQHRLIIDVLDGVIELTVSHNGMAQFARSVKLPESGITSQRVLSEVRRTIASYSNQPTPGDIERVTIIGNSNLHQKIQDQLSLRLKVDVDLYDPLNDCIVTSLENTDDASTPDEPAQFTALIGTAFQLQIGESSTLDFVNPRKPPVPISPIRKNFKYIALGVVALFLAAFFLIRPITTAQNRISELQTALQDKPTKDKTNKALTDRLQQLETFEASKINWLDELVSISNKFPPAEQALVDRFTAKNAPSGRGASETLGQIYVDVHLLNAESLQMLETNLLTPSYRITGTGIQSDKENAKYPFVVTERIQLVKPPQQENNQKGDSATSDATSDREILPETDPPKSQSLQTTKAPVRTTAEEL